MRGARLFDHGGDLDRLPQTTRVFQRKSRAHGVRNFVERDRGRGARPDRRDESLPLAAMAFVLAQKRSNYALRSSPNKFQAAKILEHSDDAATEYFNSLFGRSFVPIGQIANRAERAICKTQ